MKRILIANRGEIAARIIRSAREAGYSTVAVYADQDLTALHTELADTALPLHGSTAAETYLDPDKLLRAASISAADAVHPGYGFLSENAEFAQAVIDAGLTWIGPRPETIEALGNKITAREIAMAAGAPLVPGTDGPVANAEQVRSFVQDHGLPVAIKAAHGGGGRGMRVVRQEAEIDDAYASAVREAETAFGRGECFVERFLDRPRHVEAQVVADAHGNVVVVGTRDCSLQRRNQKLVEEAPAPFLDQQTRQRIHDSARAICAEAGYLGAGTVEYLLSPDGLLSFLEVNTRLQVEHPVTEETSGIDLVAEQLRIAEGQRLSITADPVPRGHSLEFRINAEDPALGFLPTPGPVELFQAPAGAGIRVETAVRSGDEVSGAFDSMFAKLIVTASDRDTAIRRARTALAEMRIEGLPTVLPFHRSVLQAPDFVAADGDFKVHTRWIETDFGADLEASPYLQSSVQHREQRLHRAVLELDGRAVPLGLPSSLLGLFGSAADSAVQQQNTGNAETVITSPMAGTLVKWLADDAQHVTAGDAVAVVEAMKMEQTISARISGTFRRAALEPGAALSSGDTLGSVD